MSAWLLKARRASSRHRRDARVYGHTTTAMHKLSTPSPPPATAAVVNTEAREAHGKVGSWYPTGRNFSLAAVRLTACCMLLRCLLLLLLLLLCFSLCRLFSPHRSGGAAANSVLPVLAQGKRPNQAHPRHFYTGLNDERATFVFDDVDVQLVVWFGLFVCFCFYI